MYLDKDEDASLDFHHAASALIRLALDLHKRNLAQPRDCLGRAKERIQRVLDPSPLRLRSKIELFSRPSHRRGDGVGRPSRD